MHTGDRVLRYVDGEWVNVSAKCKREKNLGYFIDNKDSCNDGEYDQTDDDVEDDYAFCYRNNQRPDLFWMGDGLHKQALARRQLDRASMSRPIIHHVYDDGDRALKQQDSKHAALLFNRYPAISSITLVQKTVAEGGKPRPVRLPQLPSPPPLAVNYPKYRGYHPYGRPMIAAVAPRARARDAQPTRIALAKCCCCNNPSVVPMLAQVNSMPFQMKWIKPKGEPSIESDSGQGPSNAVAAIEQNSDEQTPIIENRKHTDHPESPKENDEI